MVRKIELRVFSQQLVASQRGPSVGRAAVGQAGQALGTEHFSSRMDIRELGETGWRRQREEGEEKRVLRR